VISHRSIDTLPVANPTVAPEEPLAVSAPLAWAEAPGRCFRDPETGQTCAAYHRVWQYLRLLGIISAARTNTDFMIDRFRQCAATGWYPRALVSATADYSMLAHLSCAYAAEHAPLDVTVVDRCPTAVFLNRWYASRYGFPITAVTAGVLDYMADRTFDLVCTHNFLSSFDPESRARLVARWHALLRPGGVVVTTQRVQPDQTADRNVIDKDEARELSCRTVEAAHAYPQRLDVAADELGAAVYDFAIARETYAIRTTNQITDLFEAAGFHLDLADEGGDAERARDRPTRRLNPGSYRMRIVARRR
jgi:SAM-dependent methyltransferase